MENSTDLIKCVISHFYMWFIEMMAQSFQKIKAKLSLIIFMFSTPQEEN